MEILLEPRRCFSIIRFSITKTAEVVYFGDSNIQVLTIASIQAAHELDMLL